MLLLKDNKDFLHWYVVGLSPQQPVEQSSLTPTPTKASQRVAGDTENNSLVVDFLYLPGFIL